LQHSPGYFTSMIKYSIFAMLSIGVNLIFQYFTFEFYTKEGSLYLAMIIGTFAGLLLKYILDKNFIFYHEVKSKKEDMLNFIIYSSMGVFTTIIFWGTELLFEYLFIHENAKYIGAIIGLVIGYIIKYFLDKRFVFVERKI